MSNIILSVAVASLALLFSTSLMAQNIQYLGPNSTDPDAWVTGDGGVFDKNELCVEAFGGSSQMCNSNDILLSGSLAPSFDPSGVQWVLPSIVAAVPVNDEVVIIDASGLTSEGHEGTLSCHAWSSASPDYRGLVIRPDASFGAASCANPHPVACCKVSK